MRSGAFVVGLVGGLLSFAMGVVSFAFGQAGSSLGVPHSGLVMLLGAVVPLPGLVGAAVVRGKPVLGGTLMLAASVGLFVLLGINCFSLVPGTLLGLGGVLALASLKESRP